MTGARRATRGPKRSRRVLITVGALLELVIVLAFVLVYLRQVHEQPPGHTATCAYATDQPAAANGDPVARPTPTTSRAGYLQVRVLTTRGVVRIVMDHRLAPCAVHSFAFLAHNGYYDGAPCVRTARAALPVAECDGRRPGYSLPREVGLSQPYPAGTVGLNAGDANAPAGALIVTLTSASHLPVGFEPVGKVADSGARIIEDVSGAGFDIVSVSYVISSSPD